jgi:hypothetical protein
VNSVAFYFIQKENKSFYSWIISVQIRKTICSLQLFVSCSSFLDDLLVIDVETRKRTRAEIKKQEYKESKI